MRIFNVLLRLYPPEYRCMFESEVLLVLEASHKHCQRQWASYFQFVVSESFGLIRGAISEWIAKLTTEGYANDLRLADDADHTEVLPAEVAEARKQVKFILSQMEHAIAHHQFEKARFYSEEERKARENLRLVQQRYQIIT